MRFPPKRILVPFDLSETSMAAWAHAEHLARRFGSELEALYVEPWEIASEFIPPHVLTPTLRKEILDHIHRRLGAGVKVHVLEGDPVVLILRLARTRRPDLIVMGTHGRTGLERVWRGSVAESVVRLSPVPVLVARERPRAIHSVLAPVNFTDYSELGFSYAAALAGAFHASLTVLHAAHDAPVPDAGYEFARLMRRLPAGLRRGCHIRTESREGKAYDEILLAAARHGLVVLVAHRRSLLKDFVIGTTAERVLRHCPVPVLAVPSPKAGMPVKEWTAEHGESAVMR